MNYFILFFDLISLIIFSGLVYFFIKRGTFFFLFSILFSLLFVEIKSFFLFLTANLSIPPIFVNPCFYAFVFMIMLALSEILKMSSFQNTIKPFDRTLVFFPSFLLVTMQIYGNREKIAIIYEKLFTAEQHALLEEKSVFVKLFFSLDFSNKRIKKIQKRIGRRRRREAISFEKRERNLEFLQKGGKTRIIKRKRLRKNGRLKRKKKIGRGRKIKRRKIKRRKIRKKRLRKKRIR